jgi:hypothetical protein
LFQPTSEDIPRVSTLAHMLDGKALECMESANCEKVYFSRALVSLFENREAARASFRHVIEHNTASPLAMPSQLWLAVIESTEDGLESSPSIVLMAQFVREWMERELGERTIDDKALRPSKPQAEVVDQSRVVLGLQRQLRERDHQLAGLRAQLKALKFIDEDHQQRKVKVPASLRAAEEYMGR